MNSFQNDDSAERRTRFHNEQELQGWFDQEPSEQEAARLMAEGRIWRGMEPTLLATFPNPGAQLVEVVLNERQAGRAAELACNPYLPQPQVDRLARWALGKLTGDWTRGEWILNQAGQVWQGLAQGGHRPDDQLVAQLAETLEKHGPYSVIAPPIEDTLKDIAPLMGPDQLRRILNEHPDWKPMRRGLAQHPDLREHDAKWLLATREDGGDTEAMIALGGRQLVRSNQDLLQTIASYPRLELKAAALAGLSEQGARMVVRQMMDRDVKRTIRAVERALREQNQQLTQPVLAEFVSRCPQGYRKDIIRAVSRWGESDEPFSS